MNRYKYERTTLQFPKKFIEYLKMTIPAGTNMNKYLMELTGYKKNEEEA